MKSLEKRLSGGKPNSLGNTVEVVEEVLKETTRFEELLNCFFSHDQWVRLRTSNAMKRICAVDSSLLIPHIDVFINRVSIINQASVQWTVAQLFLMLEESLTIDQHQKAIEIVKTNFTSSNDWIVLNMSMETLTQWAKNDHQLREWLIPKLEERTKDERKSVSKKAEKSRALLC